MLSQDNILTIYNVHTALRYSGTNKDETFVKGSRYRVLSTHRGNESQVVFVYASLIETAAN